MNKLETLKSNLVSRNTEVENYQINIDNFDRAIAKINADYSDNTDMIEFRDHISNILKSNKKEQLKAIIIRDVIAEQISELEAN